MLDPRLVSDQPELIAKHLARRNADEETLAIPARIASLSEERNTLLQKAEAGRATRNQLSPQIGRMMKEGKKAEAEELKLQVKEASESVKAAEEALGVAGAIAGRCASMLLHTRRGWTLQCRWWQP